ncbi:rhoGAP domain-containing protein [Hirsutella rhossiliensis]|uniref:RhoGAP domain-containing protein n=1 Tax=Hirsutella rhossiliensis TaxID=111463 RepID=A0A9P8SMG4_9HYPO|nr:rhoGAP domain-containing protein [Hirsutella rhossiliensis]KAH0967309.1 rhoGAP domain-containing protein [Hirsutella rhossiliensis]
MSETPFPSQASNPSSPREEAPSLNSSDIPNATRDVSDPLTSKPPPPSKPFSPKSPTSRASNKPAMAAPAAAALGEVPKSLPRNSSIDTAISAVSSTSSSVKSNPQNDQHKAIDIAGLIKAAGSPEVVIQHLLKEKQSQHQQNSQLWRLVDKQRAMILGLNKDLEQALKEKEKYRRKLKDLMANPAVLKAAGAPHGEGNPEGRRGVTLPPVDVASSKAPPCPAPESPSIESDSQKNSPVEVSMAPYPITPPADRPQEPRSAVDELLDPNHDMPNPQEHALDKFDHEAEDKAADDERKATNEKQLREIPYNVSLPPSRSLPSDPPKVPPPKPPTSAPPTVTLFDSTLQPDERLAKFPAPPRKPPPAPLQLKPTVHREQPEDEDTDSDYDHLLEVEIIDEKRGRRRTREEDDNDRDVVALKVSEERSVSKQSSTSDVAASSPRERETSPSADTSLSGQTSEADRPTSMNPKMHGYIKRELMAPISSPGLPMSPRPLGNKAKSASLSPAMGIRAVSAPLSPRPPRQAMLLPPNAPQGSPLAVSSTHSSPGQLLNAAKRAAETNAQPEAAQTRADSPERTKVYKGLVTEEYPDLLLPPNALPSIKIKVASSRMKPSRASLLALTQLDEDPVFTLAIISRADRGELWRVEKDIVSFAKLDQRLKQCTAFTAKTPERSLFSGHAPAKLDARRVALEQYMTELLDTPLDAPTAVELCKYLSSNTLPPNADETGTAMRTPEKSGNTISPDGRPIRSGYLTKKGKNFGGWKARFFTVDGPQLKYYETPGGTHLGTIKLAHAQIGRQSQSNENQSPATGANGEELDNQYRHAFLVLEPKKKDSTSHVKHVLCAESDKERDIWVDVLLQWIDYRDPDEADSQISKALVQDRHASVAEYPGGQRIRKGNQSRSSHQPTGSDPLIGVRYDSMQAREAPQGAPSGLRAPAGLPDFPSQLNMGGETMSSQVKMISGPRDPQVISDSSAWGNRMGAPIPTTEDKKQRKRSFFGFGPKTRSSSDGQDSLFGGSETGSLSTPPQGSYQGLARQVFGAPLGEAVRFCSPVDVDVPLPCVVYRCVEYLDKKNGIHEEGIFRLSGSNVVIKQLRERFNTECDVNLLTDDQYYDIHAVASLLKLYLRELPTTILTRELQREFLMSTEIPDRAEKIAALKELATMLPQINATLLKYLISFLIKIIHNADVNKMNVRNVGIVFSPTLNIPAPVFALFLQHYQEIFGIDPERYEPPSGTPEPDPRRGRFDARPRSEMPPRASTSSGSASPQRRMQRDSRRENPRSTPTPPLMQMARSSPTPPSATSRQQHDAAHLAQQRASTAGTSSRPAYESGYGLPVGHELYQHVQTQRPLPGYERPIYGAVKDDHSSGGQPADQPQQSAIGKRRESSIYMGAAMGLQHPGSKSRLREEARF